MKRFLVGINGEHTPDPEYWRARNEVITAKDETEATESWKSIHECWYCGEPISVATFPHTEEEKMFPNASSWKFTNNGCMEI